LAGGTTTKSARGRAASSDTVGPPLLILALGFASVLVSMPLVVADGIPSHVIGYLTGSLVPIIIIGLIRRIDLERRRSPLYVPRSMLRPALAVLAMAAFLAAGLHVWPIATELAS
jgi:hypothetical protein